MNEHDDISRLEEGGKPAKKPFKNGDAALQFAKRLETEDKEKRSPFRRRILAMLDGRKPWADADGTNINWGEGEDVIERLERPYIERLNQEDHPIQVTLRIPGMARTARQKIEEGISCAASEAYRDWPGRHSTVSGIVRDMVSFGVGWAYWPSEIDPRFRRVLPWKIFLPPNTGFDLDAAEAVVIKEAWTMKQVYEFYDKADDGDNNIGWNKGNLKRILEAMYHSGTSHPPDESNWEQLQVHCRENQMIAATDGKPVDVFLIAINNLESGKTDIYIVADTAGQLLDSKNVQGEQELGLFLRERKGAYDRMTDFVQCLPLRTHDASVHGTRGHGHNVEPKSKILSQLKNIMIDSVDEQTTNYWQSADSEDTVTASIIQRGRNAILPESLTAVDLKRSNQDFQSLAALSQVMHIELLRGNGGTGDPTSLGKRQSATKERIEQLEKSGLSSIEVLNFEGFFDRIVENFFRRLCSGMLLGAAHGEDMITVFKDEMESMDIPSEFYKDKVKAVMLTRSVGPGSPLIERESASAILTVMPFLSPEGRYNVVKLFIKSFVGPCRLEDFMLPFDEIDNPTTEHWRAWQENNDLIQGQQHPVISQDDHKIHLAIHMQGATQTLESMEQLLREVGEEQVQPDQLLPIMSHLDALMNHLDEHMNGLAQQPQLKEDWNTFRPQVEGLRRTHSEVRAMLENSQERAFRIAQEQQQALAEQNAVDPSGDQKLRHKEVEHQQKLRHDQEKHQLDAQSHLAAEQRRNALSAAEIEAKLREDV